MNRYYGNIGYFTTEETAPGVWVETFIERPYYGNIETLSRRLQPTESINDDIRITNRISILADPFATENFWNIKYAIWMGKKWKVETVEVKHPRLVLTLGGLFHD